MIVATVLLSATLADIAAADVPIIGAAGGVGATTSTDLPECDYDLAEKHTVRPYVADADASFGYDPTTRLSRARLRSSAGFLATKGLGTRADELHAVLDPIAAKNRTTAVLRTEGEGGRSIDVLGCGKRDLSPAQRAIARDDEIVARLLGEHAEITALREAMSRGLRPRAIATTRDFCPACRRAFEASGARITDPRTAVWARRG